MRPGPGDIPLNQAEAKAAAFVKSIGLPAGDFDPNRCWLEPQSLTNIRAWSLSGERYRIDVDSKTGRIVAFMNLRPGKRPNSQAPIKLRFTDRARSKAYVLDYAARLGVPNDCGVEWLTPRNALDSGLDARLQFGARFTRNRKDVAILTFWSDTGEPLALYLYERGVSTATAAASTSARIHLPPLPK
ncbi:MAG TPA: hypothetical protein VMI31_05750, partial [Fimbriimonadaceae bacterium]|nr:hypothetical protein [Fimbriimonadaceae bacterium]